MRLEVELNLCRPSEVAFETKRGTGGDRALTFDDFVDATRWDADILCHAVFREFEWDEEILAQNLTRVDGRMCFHGINDSR